MWILLFSSINIDNLPVENSISILLPESPFLIAAKAVAQAAVPQALVRPAPLSHTKIDPNKDTSDEINIILKNYIIELMKPLENFEFFKKKQKLNTILISGVNGVGKTTTIGKISKIFKGNGNKVMLAASDTFRAAAIEQLENWAKKVDVSITKSSQ